MPLVSTHLGNLESVGHLGIRVVLLLHHYSLDTLILTMPRSTRVPSPPASRRSTRASATPNPPALTRSTRQSSVAPSLPNVPEPTISRRATGARSGASNRQSTQSSINHTSLEPNESPSQPSRSRKRPSRPTSEHAEPTKKLRASQPAPSQTQVTAEEDKNSTSENETDQEKRPEEAAVTRPRAKRAPPARVARKAQQPSTAGFSPSSPVITVKGETLGDDGEDTTQGEIEEAGSDEPNETPDDAGGAQSETHKTTGEANDTAIAPQLEDSSSAQPDASIFHDNVETSPDPTGRLATTPPPPPVRRPPPLPPMKMSIDNMVRSGEPRLVIHQIVLNNFKSYAGRQVIGPFHKVRVKLCSSLVNS